MTLTKVFTLTAFAVGIASAASNYSVKLYDSMWIGATQLKPGDYTIEMKGDKAVFRTGKKMVEVPATMGSNEQKYKFTSFVAVDSKLHEIDLGGTKSKIVFSPEAPSAGN
jgi:hypothetical protein